MKQRAFTIRVAEYDSLDALSASRADLVRRAMEASGSAYAPYSRFRVGAAALLEGGEVITGNNQENAAYPSGLCAERVALFHAGSLHPGKAVLSLAVAGRDGNGFTGEPLSPCGSCRQVLFESELRGRAPMEVILYGTRMIRILRSAADLLPLPFTLPGTG